MPIEVLGEGIDVPSLRLWLWLCWNVKEAAFRGSCAAWQVAAVASNFHSIKFSEANLCGGDCGVRCITQRVSYSTSMD